MRRSLLKFLIVFLVSITLVTLYFIFLFKDLADTITPKIIFKVIKQFALIVSIPASLLFLLLDIPMEKIKNLWLLLITRCVVLFILLYMVSGAFSFYLIANSLFDNPFIE
ncbi:hypothetical protein D0C36_18695 [Mucilaginibacter conchicola]|uniref:Uncharacterized protein n=1 Tax=Mucilaginibacter conchicola TaxID=2303333 RepID=A0A372NRJ1_9SPHI|nr:hypothetical protein [Mucilaginibacter conchicola]RFZ90975.1 hypothetical protein D0C36_18695 [Mucilaginibacter conchicola]